MKRNKTNQNKVTGKEKKNKTSQKMQQLLDQREELMVQLGFGVSQHPRAIGGRGFAAKRQRAAVLSFRRCMLSNQQSIICGLALNDQQDIRLCKHDKV